MITNNTPSWKHLRRNLSPNAFLHPSYRVNSSLPWQTQDYSRGEFDPLLWYMIWKLGDGYMGWGWGCFRKWSYLWLWRTFSPFSIYSTVSHQCSFYFHQNPHWSSLLHSQDELHLGRTVNSILECVSCSSCCCQSDRMLDINLQIDKVHSINKHIFIFIFV